MSDSGVPTQGQGGNKLVVLLLIGGVVILIVAGFVLLRRGEPEKPEPPPVVDTGIETPAPLVIEQPSRPLSPEPDAGSEVKDTESQEKKPGRRRADRMGTIDAKEVNSFINARFGQVKACYERRLKTNTFLEGKLDLNIGVSSQGKVTSVGVNKDTIRDAQMLSCVKQVINGWDFPKPTGGRVTIAKTFNFKKKKSN